MDLDCKLSTLVNITGLCIDIAGALLMYFNSPKVSYKTYLYNREEEEKLEMKAGRMHKLTKLGAILLVIGFLFQLIGNLL